MNDVFWEEAFPVNKLKQALQTDIQPLDQRNLKDRLHAKTGNLLIPSNKYSIMQAAACLESKDTLRKEFQVFDSSANRRKGKWNTVGTKQSKISRLS